MKKLTVFYLESCPYCVKAQKALKELKAENPAYEKADIQWIEESRNQKIADNYDYYYVPCVFCGNEKLYECSPADDYGTIKQKFEAALKTAAEG